MEIILVEWDDSFFTHGWRDRGELDSIGSAHCVSVGVKVREDDKQITLVLSLGDNTFADSMTIPKGCVKRVRQLKITNNKGEVK